MSLVFTLKPLERLIDMHIWYNLNSMWKTIKNTSTWKFKISTWLPSSIESNHASLIERGCHPDWKQVLVNYNRFYGKGTEKIVVLSKILWSRYQSQETELLLLTTKHKALSKTVILGQKPGLLKAILCQKLDCKSNQLLLWLYMQEIKVYIENNTQDVYSNSSSNSHVLMACMVKRSEKQQYNKNYGKGSRNCFSAYNRDK